jgi:hypothetical protein
MRWKAGDETKYQQAIEHGSQQKQEITKLNMGKEEIKFS